MSGMRTGIFAPCRAAGSFGNHLQVPVARNRNIFTLRHFSVMLLQSKETAVNLGTQTETELEVLKSIATMLVALACLADRVWRAPFPVRAFVLWLLRRAESVVRECVAGQAWPAVRAGNDPADALDLAASLRALARAVEKLAAQYRQFGRRWLQDDASEADGVERDAAGRRRRIAIAWRRSYWVDLGTAPCPDTS